MRCVQRDMVHGRIGTMDKGVVACFSSFLWWSVPFSFSSAFFFQGCGLYSGINSEARGVWMMGDARRDWCSQHRGLRRLDRSAASRLVAVISSFHVYHTFDCLILLYLSSNVLCIKGFIILARRTRRIWLRTGTWNTCMWTFSLFTGMGMGTLRAQRQHSRARLLSDILGPIAVTFTIAFEV